MEPGVLTNRELASLICLAVVCGWVLLRRRSAIDSSGWDLLRAARPILPIFLLYSLWVGAVVFVAARVGAWDRSLLKDTVLWVLLSGIGLLASSPDALKRSGWFRRVFISAVGATAILEFVINAKSFPLMIEVALQPLIFVIMVTPVIARGAGQRQIRSVAAWLAAFIGIVALAWTARALVVQWSEIDKAQVLRQAVLPMWLTVGAMSFLYPFSLYMAYEGLWRRMRWLAGGRSVRRQELATLAYAGPRLGVLRDLQGGAIQDLVRAEGFTGALQAIHQVRLRRIGERRAQRAAAKRLIENAGLEGWDRDGKRLDQREFAETRKALQWLATCHMGHYRYDEKYKPDLLALVESHFAEDGLPEAHGIAIEVAPDGQSWYAYRQTVAGWYFAIGAVGPPPNQWCYDGPQPPTGYPNEQSWSRFGGGECAPHW